MTYLVYAYIFVIGSVVGSFLTLCIDRIPRNKSIITPRSHCDNCDVALTTLDLIPILSFIFLKGKCRHCGMKISCRSTYVEVFTGLMYMVLYYKYGCSLEFAKYVVILSTMVIVSIIDYYTYNVYLNMIYVAVLMLVVINLIQWFTLKDIDIIFNMSTSIILGFGIIYILYRITKGKGIGLGDAYILGMFGVAMNPMDMLYIILYSSIAGIIGGMITIKYKGKDKSFQIPFGPYLFIGWLINILLG